MRLTLDHRSPVPLYHQLAEAIRYRIATGELKSGTVLPPLRRGAEIWAVNLHTVRRAYAELGRIGVVTTRAPHGTRILPGRAEKRGRPAPAARGQFLQSVVTEARLRHALGVDELIRLLRGLQAPSQQGAISVVECSETQCADLAGQIEELWRVSAAPWVVEQDDPPPDGLVVATYFHYNDVRLRWPGRLPDVRFLAAPARPPRRRPQVDRRSLRERGGDGQEHHRRSPPHPSREGVPANHQGRTEGERRSRNRQFPHPDPLLATNVG
jgi:DNA-binding transcriptional regulator YhcF (GntR family)